MKITLSLLLLCSSFGFCGCDENIDAIKAAGAKTQPAIDQALSDCKAFHTQQKTYLSELAILSSSLIGNTLGYDKADAATQIQINMKLARITELKILLGNAE